MLYGFFGLGVLEMAFVGAIIGGLVGAIIYMFSNRDKGDE